MIIVGAFLVGWWWYLNLSLVSPAVNPFLQIRDLLNVVSEAEGFTLEEPDLAIQWWFWGKLMVGYQETKGG
jgi:hypothetical protein